MIPFTDLTILKSEALESARAGVCAQDFNSSRFHHTARSAHSVGAIGLSVQPLADNLLDFVDFDADLF